MRLVKLSSKQIDDSGICCVWTSPESSGAGLSCCSRVCYNVLRPSFRHAISDQYNPTPLGASWRKLGPGASLF